MLRDLLATTARSLWASRFRFGLTALGIVWGAMMLTYLSATADGYDAHFEVQLDKLGENLARRQRNFALTAEQVARWPHLFTLPRLTEGVETGWHMFPLLVRPEGGVRRADLQRWMEAHGVDTRMVWTGNVTRQPAFRDVPHRVPDDGLPNADRVMDRALSLPTHHALTSDDLGYIVETLDELFQTL